MRHEIMVALVLQVCVSTFSEQVTYTHVPCNVPRTDVPCTDVPCADVPCTDVPWTQAGGNR